MLFTRHYELVAASLCLLLSMPTDASPRLAFGTHPNMFTGNKQLPETFTNSALRSIGRLYIGDTTQCTATLIKPNVIVANAHCVLDADTHLLIIQNSYLLQVGKRKTRANACGSTFARPESRRRTHLDRWSPISLS